MSISARAMGNVQAPGGQAHPSQRMISDSEVEKALDWLRDNSQAMGDAKARTIKAGHMLKHVEALMFKASDAKSVEAKKADARTSDRFLEAITEDALAAGEYEKLKSLREAAALKIEAWRTEQASFRAMKI
jgi:rhamnose utilization protein RhaD (predicted bifunctional aldolase and dehydrogenase)